MYTTLVIEEEEMTRNISKMEGGFKRPSQSRFWQEPAVWRNAGTANIGSTMKTAACWASNKCRGNPTDSSTQCLLDTTRDEPDVMPPQNPAARENARRAYVKSTVTRLVCQAFKRRKGDLIDAETQVIIQRLVHKTWAKVQDVDFDVSGKTFIDKTIFSYVSKKMGNTALVQQALRSGFEPVDTYIVFAIQQHVMPPSKISSCFSRVRSVVGTFAAKIINVLF